MFLLALSLGRTVAELETSLDSDELTEWAAFYDLMPFGPTRDNMHAALVASTLVNMFKAKGTPPAKMSAFMFNDAEGQRANETKRIFSALFAMGRDARR